MHETVMIVKIRNFVSKFLKMAENNANLTEEVWYYVHVLGVFSKQTSHSIRVCWRSCLNCQNNCSTKNVPFILNSYRVYVCQGLEALSQALSGCIYSCMYI